MITNSEAFASIVYGHELRVENGNLVFPNLFRHETGVKIVNPTTTGVQSTNFPLETGLDIFSDDLVVPNASNYTDASWSSNGWEPAARMLPRQVGILIGKNKPLDEMNQKKNVVIIKGVVDGTNYTLALIFSGNLGSLIKPISFSCYPFLPRVIGISDVLNDISSDPLDVLSIKRVSGGTYTTTLFNGKISSITFTANVQADSVGWLVVETQNKNTLVIEEYLVTMYVEQAPPVNAGDDIFNMIQWDSVTVTTAQLLANDTTSYPPITFLGLESGSAVGGTASISGSNITFTGTGLTGEPAGFKYRIRDAQNNQAVGNVSINVLELPPIEAYLFSGDDLTIFLAEYTPPTQQTIFNSWARFGNNTNYFTSPPYSGEAASWTMNGSNFMCTVNSSYFTGFISPKSYSNYTHTATLSSTANDNDTIALVAAFKRDGTTNRSLMVIREGGGNTSYTSSRGFSFMMLTNGTIQVIKVPASSSGYRSVGNWSSIGKTRVRVQRIGNTFIAQATPWTTGTPTNSQFHVNSRMELDLTQYPALSWALGEAPYGYACMSQQNSLFSNVEFEGGLANEVMDPINNTVYTYNGTNWVASPTATIQSVLGYPRTVTNPETGRVYRIEADSVTDITPE